MDWIKNIIRLDAQHDAGENYINSQRHEGWRIIPTHYDDGGFTGGNMERPALKQLMADIEAGLIDVVVVYKIDRLSRSLTDFAQMVDLFDKYDISFVSVTQHFNTPVGHLKDLDDELEMIRQHLIKEVREVGRALHWIDGIIKLKSIEREQQPSNPIVEVRS